MSCKEVKDNYPAFLFNVLRVDTLPITADLLEKATAVEAVLSKVVRYVCTRRLVPANRLRLEAIFSMQSSSILLSIDVHHTWI